MISREEVREKLTGPIASLTTPFTRDGEIDYLGLRKLIDGNLEGGSNSSLLTYGDSLFSLMTDDEIAEVTRVVAEHTGKRGTDRRRRRRLVDGQDRGVRALLPGGRRRRANGKAPDLGGVGHRGDLGGALRGCCGRDPGHAGDQHLGQRHGQGTEDGRNPVGQGRRR